MVNGKMLILGILLMMVSSCEKRALQYSGENRILVSELKEDVAQVAEFVQMPNKPDQLRREGNEIKRSGEQILKEAEKTFFGRVVEFVRENTSAIVDAVGQAVTGNWGGLVTSITTLAGLAWATVERRAKNVEATKKRYYANSINEVAGITDLKEANEKVKEIFKKEV